MNDNKTSHKLVSVKSFKWGSIIPELQNRVIYYDVTNRVTNPKILCFFNFSS